MSVCEYISWIFPNFKTFYISVKDKNEPQSSILTKIKQNIFLQDLILTFHISILK